MAEALAAYWEQIMLIRYGIDHLANPPTTAARTAKDATGANVCVRSDVHHVLKPAGHVNAHVRASPQPPLRDHRGADSPDRDAFRLRLLSLGHYQCQNAIRHVGADPILINSVGERKAAPIVADIVFRIDGL